MRNTAEAIDTARAINVLPFGDASDVLKAIGHAW
jgi:hypothetical protein